ncbi:phosphoenolpyruvate--protein phosphotransferase [Paenibacillus turpanensis]|uniref:phosphoenolpyruvate--protein phosphotransferase n=1 Tax=Paenibacillus turpanensis TaxID=2689078 RepID=UPI00140A5D33
MTTRQTLKGIGASSGIVTGKAFVLPSWEWELPDKMIDVTDLAAEFERLSDGIRTSKREIRSIKNELSDVIGGEPSSIFDAHLAILDDPIFMNEIQGIIQRQYKAAEVAVKEVIDKFVNMFDLLDDDYMKERALDIKDVGNRLLKHLLGKPDVVLPETSEPFILVAKEISPSQLAHLNPSHVIGVVTMAGGVTSHAAIMARAMAVPLVMGLEGKLDQPIQTGDLLIIDGEEGLIYVNPTDAVISEYKLLQAHLEANLENLKRIALEQAKTLDGTEIHLEVNITSLKELDQALQYGAVGVGLFRTEFVYMDRDAFPNEEEQYDVYRSAAEKMGHRPVIIRTLDVGADKQLEYLSLNEEENPVLGYRAIRISLDRTDLFKTQLRAILRATVHGNVKVLFPMITSVDEIRQAKALLEEAKDELRREGLPFKEDIPVGIMIEVPAAALIADLLAEEVEFFSIGTNDLTQYVLAVDRMNEHIAHMYDPYQPGVLRIIRDTVLAAKRAGIELGVCGEMAGDVRALPFWLGLGVNHLSMSVQSLLPLKQRVLQARTEEAVKRLEQVMRCTTSAQVKALMDPPARLTAAFK